MLSKWVQSRPPPEGMSDEDHQAWLAARTADRAAAVDTVEQQRKRLRSEADTNEAIDMDVGAGEPANHLPLR